MASRVRPAGGPTDEVGKSGVLQNGKLREAKEGISGGMTGEYGLEFGRHQAGISGGFEEVIETSE